MSGSRWSAVLAFSFLLEPALAPAAPRAAEAPAAAQEAAAPAEAEVQSAYKKIQSAFVDLDKNLYPGTGAQVELGRQLFFDPRLSTNGKMSCASCHQPERGWTDGL